MRALLFEDELCLRDFAVDNFKSEELQFHGWSEFRFIYDSFNH